MQSVHLIPAVEATIFTVGCAIIQAQRHRALQITKALTAIIFVALLAIIFTILPQEQLDAAAAAIAGGDTGTSALTYPE